jgi:hypothetical protein
MRRLRRVTEAEVVSEFLRNEFYRDEFQRDRQHFQHLVFAPDLANELHNAVRRALLFRRRGHMWRELPADTQWWEVRIDLEDLNQLRVFPRAQWRQISNGSFRLTDIVHRIQHQEFNGRVKAFIAKVYSLSYRLRSEEDSSSIILIGVDEHHPMTILEGNHRLTAACLASPQLLQQRFRVLVGFSPHMTESCWYETNLPNLWRYAKNRLRNLYHKEADIDRVAAAAAREATVLACADMAPVPGAMLAAQPAVATAPQPVTASEPAVQETKRIA